MIYIDLFAGIGGFALGMNWASITPSTHYFSEIDPYCVKLYQQNFPNAIPLGDIKEINTYALKQKHPNTPILISGGFPCQDISVAGKGAGIHGSRSSLWFEMYRIIRDLQPVYAVIENVGAVVRNGLKEILYSLASIGYDAEWQDIRAADMGAPHKRERIWILAYPDLCGRRSGSDPERQYKNDQVEIREIEKDIKQWNQRKHRSGKNSSDVAYTNDERLQGQLQHGSGSGEPRRYTLTGASVQRTQITWWDTDPADVPDPTSLGLSDRAEISVGESEKVTKPERPNWWATEPNLGGRFNGLPLWLERHIGREMSYEESQRAIKILPSMWETVDTKTVQWTLRGFGRIQQAEILFSLLCEYQKDSDKTRLLTQSKEAFEGFVRSVWIHKKLDSPSYRPEYNEQQFREHPDSMQTLSRFLAYDGEKNESFSGWEDGIPRLAKNIPHRVDRLKALGNSIVPQIAYTLFSQLKDTLCD